MKVVDIRISASGRKRVGEVCYVWNEEECVQVLHLDDSSIRNIYAVLPEKYERYNINYVVPYWAEMTPENEENHWIARNKSKKRWI